MAADGLVEAVGDRLHDLLGRGRIGVQGGRGETERRREYGRRQNRSEHAHHGKRSPRKM